jgi:hypothetical protein
VTPPVGLQVPERAPADGASGCTSEDSIVISDSPPHETGAIAVSGSPRPATAAEPVLASRDARAARAAAARAQHGAQSFFCDVSEHLKAEIRAAEWHPSAGTLAPLPSVLEDGFRVRVQLQIIGGETREIPCEAASELALDLNGNQVAPVVFWVQSEQDCLLRVANRDSHGNFSVLVPTRRGDEVGGSDPFLVPARQPPVRVPKVPDGVAARRASRSNAIGIEREALYEVSCGDSAHPPCVHARWVWLRSAPRRVASCRTSNSPLALFSQARRITMRGA